jgi:negative modulator of initiation of replication
MPKLDLSAQTAAALKKTASERGCTPDELIAALLTSPSEALRSHPLVAYTAAAEFRAKTSDADRYLALLAWLAAQHRADFDDFIAHQASGRKYLGRSPEEIRETCRHNQARPIPGTHFWAIMNLDTPTKRRFLRRLMIFIGESDAVIDEVAGTLGGRN